MEQSRARVHAPQLAGVRHAGIHRKDYLSIAGLLLIIALILAGGAWAMIALPSAHALVVLPGSSEPARMKDAQEIAPIPRPGGSLPEMDERHQFSATALLAGIPWLGLGVMLCFVVTLGGLIFFANLKQD